MEKEVEIKTTIRDFFTRMSFVVNAIEMSTEEKTGALVCSVDAQPAELLISRGGEALASINHLIKRILDKKGISENNDDSDSIHGRVLVDVNGYQKKRMQDIQDCAHMLAERARFFKSSVEGAPMSSFDRRIMHEFLVDRADIKTESIGEGNSRRVVVSYVEEKAR